MTWNPEIAWAVADRYNATGTICGIVVVHVHDDAGRSEEVTVGVRARAFVHAPLLDCLYRHRRPRPLSEAAGAPTPHTPAAHAGRTPAERGGAEEGHLF